MDSEQITVSSTDREYKKKRVEELGSTLAKIRARVKANRGSAAKNEDEVQSSGGSKLPEDSERTALTTKLEEDRVRFSKHQSEKAKIKEAMDQIMIDCEEQKKVEKQLQEAIAKVTAPAPELPPLIKQRIIDLETSVETLKERLYEKDKVLSSKSQALTVLHNQLMQRSQEHAERAMAITQEISALKEDFGKREENWKKEMLRLKSREEELEQRLAEKESHTADVESLQLELALIRQSLCDASNKNEEFSNKLETVNKINLKLKAQLKAVKQERDKLKESLESSGGVEALKNQIAVLEEEKGNLQLQLVDFDDIKESLQSASLRADSLEEEMSKLKESLKHLMEEKEALLKGLDEANKATDHQMSIVEQLKTTLKEVEEQKISAEMRSIEVEEKLEMLQSSTSRQIEQLLSELSLMKSQYDEQNVLIDSLNNKLSLKDQEIADIKGNNFPAEVETETRLKEIESYNSELVEKIRELQLKCEGHEQAVVQLNESLNERNETNNQLRSKYEQTVASFNDTKKIIENLQNENEKLKSEIESMIKKEKQSSEGVAANAESKEDSNLAQKFKKLAANYKIRTKLCQDLEEKLKNLNDVLEEKDKAISQLSEQETELKAEIDSLKNKEQELNIKLENVQTKNHKLLAIIEDLTPKLEALEAERSAALVNVDKMNKAFEELKEWKEGDSKLLKEHVTSVNSMASHVLLLEDELGKLQSIVSEKNTVIGDLETERKKLVEDMRNSEVELERLRALYQQESVKNQNVLTNLEGLESEMLVSRKEMDMIAEQLDAVTKNYNACLGNLQERENYIEALEQDIIGMKSKMYNLESGIEDKHRMLQERGNQLSAKLEQAEIMRHAYDKYQVEMEKKFKLMEENEKSLKTNILLLQNEIEILKNSNSELMKEKEEYEAEKSKMASEISTLNDIRNSYNSTLDRIEVLNEELKQVMDEFEAKNQELIKLSEERADLFNRLTDLEEAYGDVKSQLAEAEEVTNRLQNELAKKDRLITELQNDISNLKANFGEEKSIIESKLNIAGEMVPLQKEQNVAMFSWDEHSEQSAVKGEGDGIMTELEEKKKSLEAAQREIDNLQCILNSKLTEKDNEITLLQEQVNKLLSDKSVSDSELKSPSEDSLVKKEQDVQVFSWDQHSHEAIKEEEEGWGWIGADAHLEQDHKHSEALQIQTLTQRVKELEEEQKSLTDKLASSKIKCVKLLKKLKEMEALNEQSKNERTVGFSDLDFALQEELRSQLDKLELKNKELSNEINVLKAEKENLLKKVEVFSNANDQLVEMKERQDIEVQMWQKRSAELKNELQGLQWTIEELKSDRPSLSKGEDELSEKFNALVIENEELQRVICNLKDGRPIGSPETAVELNSLKEELKKLKEIRIKEKEAYDNESKKANEEIDALELQIDVLTKENQELNEKSMQSIGLKQEEISSLSAQIQMLNEENEKLKEKLTTLLNISVVEESDNSKKSQLEEQLNIANEEIRLLKTVIDEKSIENDKIKVQLTEFKNEMEQLLEKIQALAIENSQLKERLESYSKQLTTSQKESEDVDVLNSQLQETRNELAVLQNKIDFLESSNNNLQEQLKTINESASLEIAQHIDNLHKSNEIISKLDNGLKFTRGIIDNFETFVGDLISKMQISTISNDIVGKLKEVINVVFSELDKKKSLENEISLLKEEIAKLSPTKKEDSSVEAASFPVFKGFSAFTNDPFDNIAEIKTSIATESRPDTKQYEIMISKLEEEKTSYQNEIKDLTNQLSGLQAHLSNINVEYTKQIDEMRSKLERSEAEINHWKGQVNSLNQDINLLVQRHNQEMEDLRTNDERSREKLLEIEENYQNTLLNKEQENKNLRQSLLEKEEQFTNSVNELNSLQTQYGLISQQIFSLENRVRDLTKENQELQSELDKSKSSENTVIEKQKEEIQELMARLEYMSQSQNIQRSENEDFLRAQLTELSNHFKALEASNGELQRLLSGQAEEISMLKTNVSDLEQKKKYLESVISDKQKELDHITSSVNQQQQENQQPYNTAVTDAEIEKYVTLLKQKDLEIERVSKVLLDTQERLVQVQESKPNDKVISLQSKLDQVLYTLHARDVRCDELTQEIMQLLEERDILQLRLSESLRENDILRKGNMNKPSSPSPELQNKLGELHKGYKRDPVVQREMESRHNQQMNLYSPEEEIKEDKDASVDYGIFNWFFSSPTSSSSQQ